MSSAIKVCVFNQEPEAAESLRDALARLGFVRVQAEVSTAEELAAVLREPIVGLVMFHLDPNPADVFEIIETVSSRYPDLALVGLSHRTDPNTILSAMRSGCDQFICEPIDPQDLAGAIGRVTARRLSVMNKSRSICVMGGSGGAGATTIACNLSQEIGELTKGYCALLDLDLQFGNVAPNFDTQPKHTIRDAAELGDHLDQSALKSTVIELPCKVALLARPAEIDEHGIVTPETVRRVIQLFATLYDHVVIDVPRTIDQHTFVALEHADYILVVCQLSVPSVRNAQRLSVSLKKFGIPEERIQFVVNRHVSTGTRIQTRDVEEVIGKAVFATVPNDYQLVTQSVDFGRPLAELSKDNPVRVAIRRLAKQVALDPNRSVHGAGKEGKNGESKGFLKKLFARPV